VAPRHGAGAECGRVDAALKNGSRGVRIGECFSA